MEKTVCDGRLSRAQGCLLGQLAGDSLGGLVEFQSPEQIKRMYPMGVRQLENGVTWSILAGQPTDDSEMALALARSIVKNGRFQQPEVRKAYQDWLASEPFDCGFTTSSGLNGRPNFASQANGALMRISPLGIFGAGKNPDDLAEWAREDAEITHPNNVCLQASGIFAVGIAYAIENGPKPADLYDFMLEWTCSIKPETSILNAVESADAKLPDDFCTNQGWVLIALQNALWRLRNADSFEDAVEETVMRGGDTDTNAAICGALYGAAAGIENVPAQWVKAITSCRPEKGKRGVTKPRPECFWPCDALQLARQLVEL